MKTLAIALVAAIAAGPALASDQLAAQFGVDGTVAELALIKSTIDSSDENNDFAVRAAKARVSGDIVSTQSFGAGSQLAGTVGVDGTVAELALIKSTIEASGENNDFAVDAVKARVSGDVVSTQSGVTPGHAQFAAALGVNAADYSLNELQELKSRIDEANDES